MGQTVTFQVLEGVDKGKIFTQLPVPLTIGREEGNQLRLNDERVSRFHAKVQIDNADIILTDLESTNGTRVNGCSVQIRRLRAGDRIGIGRSVLLFGSNEEIAARQRGLNALVKQLGGQAGKASPGAVTSSKTLDLEFDPEREFNLDPTAQFSATAEGELFFGTQQLPPLPQKLTPAQIARLAEILEFLHRGLASASDNIQANEEGTQILLTFADWQKVQIVQMLLARYLRMIADPEEK